MNTINIILMGILIAVISLIFGMAVGSAKMKEQYEESSKKKQEALESFSSFLKNIAKEAEEKKKQEEK